MLLNCLTTRINTEEPNVVQLTCDVFGADVWDYTIIRYIIARGTQVAKMSRSWYWRKFYNIKECKYVSNL
jgi:hypothetical protein